MPLYTFFFFNWAVLSLLEGYCSSHYSSKMMTSAAELTMVASSSGFISVMNMNLWYDSDSFSMDSSEVGWHPSSSLIFIFYHFRLGCDGACLAQILWRWVGISSSVFSFCYSCLYITSLLFSITCLLHQNGALPPCHFPSLSPSSLSFFATHILWVWYPSSVAL